MAFKEGFMKAKPILLEPIMKVEIETPEDYMGDVIGDLNRRRGMVEGMDDYLLVRSFVHKYHWLKCSVMQLTWVHKLRVVLHTQWSS